MFSAFLFVLSAFSCLLCFSFLLFFLFPLFFFNFSFFHVSCLFLSFFFNFSMCYCFLLDVSVFFLIFPVLHMSRFLPFCCFFLGLGVLALLSRRGGWPFLHRKVFAIFGAGVAPSFSILGLALPVGLAVPSLGKGRPSFSAWRLALPFRVRVGISFSGEGWPFGGRKGRGGARNDPRVKEG